MSDPQSPARDQELPARAWLIGYGSRLVPYVPFEIARLPNGQRVVFVHHGEQGVRQLMVAPDPAELDPYATQMAFGADTRSVADVLAFVETTEFVRGWQVYTREYRCAFPGRATVWSTPYEVDWAFELTFSPGKREEMVYIQGLWTRSRAPVLDNLIGQGMNLIGRGGFEGRGGRCEWIVMQYLRDGETWTQRGLGLRDR
jgi:hypothetical protein